MAKATNNNKPAKRQRKAKVAAAPESAKELAERHGADWAKSNPDLVERLKQTAEYLKTLPATPGEAELAKRAAARKEMGRYVAIRDNQIAPPWLEKDKPVRPIKPQETTEPAVGAAAPKPAVKKEDIAREVIQELHGCPASTLLKNEFKTGTVRERVNEELRKRNPNAERLGWDTINRALGRDSRR
jgi:hypothetical protein